MKIIKIRACRFSIRLTYYFLYATFSNLVLFLIFSLPTLDKIRDEHLLNCVSRRGAK